jgi:hypothetical protein
MRTSETRPSAMGASCADRDADQVMPAVHGNLAGDDDRAFVVAFLDDFEQIACLVGVERFRPPVVVCGRPPKASTF